MTTELKEIPVQILSMKPGDVLLLRVPHYYDEERRFYLAKEICRAASAADVDIPLVFVPADIDLAVVKPDHDAK